MTTKYPRDIDEPICEWCNGSGEVEFTRPDGTTERGQCDHCKGTGVAKFDISDVLARTRSER
jgi:hypothetical protein